MEGETERKFLETALRPHLAQFDIDLRAMLVTTNRKRGGRGGVVTYDHLKNDLAREVAGMAPEDINEGDTTAPSKRIIKHVGIYKRNKVRVGAVAAADIGLPTLRAQCPHFDAWVSALEQLR